MALRFSWGTIMIKRVLIYDPVPCNDGSKTVMKTIVAELPSSLDVWVISNDEESWCNSNVHFVKLFSPHFLLNKTSGILYFIKHFIYLFSLISNMMKLKRFRKIIGFSGPCADFSLYLLSELVHIEIIQLIQYDNNNSRITDFGLKRASQVFYLPSTYHSMLPILKSQNNDNDMANNNPMPLVNDFNGPISKRQKSNNQIGFLWAASLLSWKRVEYFINALARQNNTYENTDKYFANLCYIEPQSDDYLNIDTLDKFYNNLLYSKAKKINDIRANSSIFTSTSKDEAFGLSILESMAAGLAIVIPADSAYWDQHLTDGYDCVKYTQNDMESLSQALTRLVNEPTLLLKISQQAKLSAQQYCNLHCYSQILKCIPN